MSSGSHAVLRKGESSTRKKASKIFTDVGGAKGHFTKTKERVKKLEGVYNVEKLKLEKAEQFRDDMDAKLCEAQEEIDAAPLPEGAQPIARIQNRDKLLFQKEQLDVAVAAQEKQVATAWDKVRVAERAMFLADKEMHMMVDDLEEAEADLAAQRDMDHEVSERLASIERKRVERWEKDQKHALKARSKQIKNLTNKAKQQIEATAELNANATRRLAGSLETTQKVTRDLREYKDKLLEERTEQVLQLKADMDFVAAGVANAATKHRTAVKAANDQLEAEKETMLAKGLNPYAEFRRKEFDQDARRRERTMKETVNTNKASLAEQMIKENEDRRKEEALERKERAYEKKHRDEQGRHVTEQRNAKYIKGVTVGGLDVLDPAGRAARVDPSQITEIPDNTYGLGKSTRIPVATMDRITDRIRSSLRLAEDDLGEYKRLVSGILPKGVDPEMLTNKSTAMGSKVVDLGDGAGTAALGATTDDPMLGAGSDEARLAALNAYADQDGAIPGIEGAATTLNLERGEEDVASLLKIVAEENLGNLGADDAGLQDAPEKKYTPVEQSKFEKDAFERAKGRLKSRLQEGQTQIAGGKEFKGQSFVPKPAIVEYKDFDVGVTYTRKFTLTNASYTFNSFRIIDLPDDIIDFFVITYDKPGRMSAGVTCTLTVTFTPKINEDIISNIRFYTETGPIAVPLVCLKKRCAPRVLSPEILFDDMVIGQKEFQPLKLKNSEALGTGFRVTRIDPVPAAIERTEEDAAAISEGAATGAVADAGSEEFAAVTDVEPSSESSPAASSGELWARVRLALTAKLRQKRKEDPFPLSMRLYEKGGNTGPKPPAGEEPQPGDVLQCEGELAGYSSAQVEVVCAPLDVGPIEQRFNVHFEKVIPEDETKDEAGQVVTMEQEVVIQARGIDMPIFVGEEVIDLKCTLHGRIYRRRVELRNRQKTAYRVNFNIPPPYDKYIEVSPDVLFVQGGASQEVNLKFVPQRDILDHIPHFSCPFEDFASSAELAIPVQMQVVNQQLPVFFVVKTVVTPSALVLSTPALDFGQVYVNQRSTLPLTVKNTSMLPQKIGFVKLKKELKVEPNGGFAVLLPNEEMKFEIAFSPSTPSPYKFNLTLMTSFNDTYNIGITGTGLEPPVVFDTSVVLMRTTSPGERVLESGRIQNKSTKRQCLEIMLPDQRFSWIKVSPTVFDLKPGESERFEIEYLPPEGCDKLDPSEWYASMPQDASPFKEWVDPATLSAEPVEGDAEGDGAASKVDTRWVRAQGPYGSLQWSTAPKKPVAAAATAANNGAGENATNDDGAVTEAAAKDETEGVKEAAELKTEASAAAGEKHAEDNAELLPQEWGIIGRWSFPVFCKQRHKTDPSMPLFFSVESSVVLPELVCDSKEIDFGQMAIGTRELKSVRIRNTSNKDIHLKTMGVSAVGPFTVLPFVRNLKPGATQNLVIECNPARPGLFTEVLELFPGTGLGHQLHVTLRTQGVDPVVKLEGLLPAPNNWSPQGGILFCGDVIPGDVSSNSFSIINQSEFAVKVVITRTICQDMPPFRQAELVQRTASGLPIFTFSPETATIETGSQLEVKAAFRPDRGRLRPFREDINIDVGQANGIIKVCLVGRPLRRQLFIAPVNALDEQFAFVSAAEKDSLSVTVENLLAEQTVSDVKSLVEESKKVLRVEDKTRPSIVLEFPDPFAADADPESYTAVEAGGGGKKGAPASDTPGRMQSKSLRVSAAAVADGRAGAGGGSYEVLLGNDAKDSGLFVVSNDKGNLNPGADMQVDIACTLPQPKGIGGLQVGSWRTFPCSVVLKGGWKPEGEPDENKVEFLLRAFVGF